MFWQAWVIVFRKTQARPANCQVTKNGKLLSLCSMDMKIRFKLICPIIAHFISQFLTTFRIAPRCADNLIYIYISTPLYCTLYFRLRAIKLVYLYIILIRKLKLINGHISIQMIQRQYIDRKLVCLKERKIYYIKI